jgi:outer membrane murein-binding lipoprotein Lpp
MNALTWAGSAAAALLAIGTLVGYLLQRGLRAAVWVAAVVELPAAVDRLSTTVDQLAASVDQLQHPAAPAAGLAPLEGVPHALVSR